MGFGCRMVASIRKVGLSRPALLSFMYMSFVNDPGDKVWLQQDRYLYEAKNTPKRTSATVLGGVQAMKGMHVGLERCRAPVSIQISKIKLTRNWGSSHRTLIQRACASRVFWVTEPASLGKRRSWCCFPNLLKRRAVVIRYASKAGALPHTLNRLTPVGGQLPPGRSSGTAGSPFVAARGSELPTKRGPAGASAHVNVYASALDRFCNGKPKAWPRWMRSFTTSLAIV